MYKNLIEARKQLSTKQFRNIQQRAQSAADQLKQSEFQLIKTLQEVEDHMVHRWCGYNSLFRYVVDCLLLSRSQAYVYVNLSQAIRRFKVLEEALQSGELTASKASRILSVINPDNESEWVTKAIVLPKRQLEKEVAKLNPKKAKGERSSYISEDVIEMKTPVSEEVYHQLVRVQDLLSQKEGRAVTMEQVFAFLAEGYLVEHDPVQKAKRIAEQRSFKDLSVPGINKNGERTSIPNEILHQVNLRDRGQCQHKYPSGERCAQERWIQFHHIKPVSKGGEHSLGNLVTLCYHHHQLAHAMGDVKLPESAYATDETGRAPDQLLLNFVQ